MGVTNEIVMKKALICIRATEKAYTLERLLLIALKVLPIIGPRIMRAAITTIATITRINAYSTRP